MIVAGTRPEVIKLAPVIWSLEKFGVDYYVFVWSGQHFDYAL
jgi:UDP-N-acetylglucosamine 2-epimerase